VVDGIEDTEDYRSFEAAIIADYEARTAVERELVLRLALATSARHSRVHSSTTVRMGKRSVGARHAVVIERKRKSTVGKNGRRLSKNDKHVEEKIEKESRANADALREDGNRGETFGT
jgi:hypothetical protein